MKKYTVMAGAALLLCLLSIGAMLYAHGQLTAQGEEIRMAENTLFGDKRQAEGIEVTTCGRYDADFGKLYWKTAASQTAAGLQAESEYRFNDAEFLGASADSSAAYIQLTAGLPESCGYEEIAPELDDSLKKAIADAATASAPGETSTAIVDLSDFCSRLPLYFRVFGLHGDDFVTDGGYFQFPLAKDSR